MEGLIPNEMDYDDWICDANTWLALGECFLFYVFARFNSLDSQSSENSFVIYLIFVSLFFCRRQMRNAPYVLASH